MSRASELRDAVVTELQTLLGDDQPVEAFVLTRYAREDLESGPRVVVRVSGRETKLAQGIDPTSVLIDIGVIGVGPDHSESGGGVTYTEAELALIDSYDELIETLLGFWMRGGAMMGGLAEHYPVALDVALHFDAKLLENESIYLSIFRVTYRDSEDE